MKEYEQPCWRCKKCNSLNCCWIRNFIPIKNWKAIPTIIINGDNETKSYKIFFCPNFELENDISLDFNKLSENILNNIIDEEDIYDFDIYY